MSGTDVHCPVSVLRQTRLSHVQWNLHRAAAVQQSSASRLHSSQAQTGSAGHYLRLQELCTGVSSEHDDYWRSRCFQQRCRAPGTVSASRLLVPYLLFCFH